MNNDVPQISEHPDRVFQRRACLLLLLGACGLVSYLFVHFTRTPHQAEALRDDGVVPLLRKELVSWSPMTCAAWGDDWRLIAAYAMIIPRSVVDHHDKDHRTLADGLAAIVEKGSAKEAEGAACWAYWLMYGPIEGCIPSGTERSGELKARSGFRARVVKELAEYKLGDPRARRPWEEQSIIDTSIKPRLIAKYKVSNGKFMRVDAGYTDDTATRDK